MTSGIELWSSTSSKAFSLNSLRLYLFDEAGLDLPGVPNYLTNSLELRYTLTPIVGLAECADPGETCLLFTITAS